jgi:hypothetical protein
VPLSHRPGHAQADFGKADGYIGGKKVRFHYFCMDLPHSDSCFVKAYPAETGEAFCDGRVVVLDFVSGVPKSILYDNLWTPPAQGDLFGVGGGNARIYVLPERSRRWPGWESAAFRRITPSASKALSYIRLGKLQSLRRAIDAPYDGHMLAVVIPEM